MSLERHEKGVVNLTIRGNIDASWMMVTGIGKLAAIRYCSPTAPPATGVPSSLSAGELGRCACFTSLASLLYLVP